MSLALVKRNVEIFQVIQPIVVFIALILYRIAEESIPGYYAGIVVFLCGLADLAVAGPYRQRSLQDASFGFSRVMVLLCGLGLLIIGIRLMLAAGYGQ